MSSRWMDDPHTARRFARFTWVLLVASFVVLTRFDFGVTAERAMTLGLVALVALLNTPVALGLYRSRAQASTRIFRVIALALVLRLAATAWVAAMTGA